MNFIKSFPSWGSRVRASFTALKIKTLKIRYLQAKAAQNSRLFLLFLAMKTWPKGMLNGTKNVILVIK